MTMKYTHIGMEERAKAIHILGCQWNSSAPDVSDSHPLSYADTGSATNDSGEKSKNPGWDRGYDASCHQEAPDDANGTEWRRLELNEYPRHTQVAWKSSLTTNWIIARLHYRCTRMTRIIG